MKHIKLFESFFEEECNILSEEECNVNPEIEEEEDTMEYIKKGVRCCGDGCPKCKGLGFIVDGDDMDMDEFNESMNIIVLNETSEKTSLLSEKEFESLLSKDLLYFHYEKDSKQGSNRILESCLPEVEKLLGRRIIFK